MVLELILCALLFIFLTPLKINFGVYINLLKNRGAVFVNLWGIIQLAQEKFVIADGEVTAKNNKEKQKTFELSKDDKDVIFLKTLINSIFRKAILERIDFFFDMGKKDDAFVSTMATSTVQILANIFLNVLRTKKYGFSSGIYCNALYLTDKLSSTLAISCWTNLYDLLFTLIKSKLKANCRMKNKFSKKAKNN